MLYFSPDLAAMGSALNYDAQEKKLGIRNSIER